jgi:hypothetical protein
MIPLKCRYLLLVAALAACGDRAPKIATLSEAMPNLPLPPDASFVSRAGGPDALKITLRSSNPADVVTAYYRSQLQKGNWRLVNEAKDSEGATVLLAQRDGPPLWVRIWAAEDGRGSLVELSGAVVPKTDSAAGAAAKPTS